MNCLKDVITQSQLPMEFKQYLENDDREGPEGVEGKGEGPKIINGQQQNPNLKFHYYNNKKSFIV